jgi:hypothetical protein
LNGWDDLDLAASELGFGVMNNLTESIKYLRLDREVLDPFEMLLLLDVVDNRLFNDARNVLGLILDGIVVLNDAFNGNALASPHFLIFGNDSLDGDLFHTLNLVVLNVLLLVGHILDSALSWDLFDDSFLHDGWSDGGRSDEVASTHEVTSTHKVASTDEVTSSDDAGSANQ